MYSCFLLAPLHLILAAARCANTTAPGSETAAPRFEQSTAFRAGEGGYVMYRIPAALVSSRGTVLLFCEGRQNPPRAGNDSGAINLLVKRSTDGGRSFGPQKVVWADGKNTCGNPCAVMDESTGTIWLLMTHNFGGDRESQIIAGTSRGTRTV